MRQRLQEIQEAVLKTLCYRDVFDYPLKEEEVIEFLVEEKAESTTVRKALAQLLAEQLIQEREGFYFLPGRSEVIETRKEREKISEEKYERALRLSKILQRIPWVKAVFLTGALAAANAKEEDDIDFLIVCAKGRVWLVRLIAYLVFILLRVKRRPGVESDPDKACLNMFLSENALAVPEEERNLFSAHEVCLARPLWAREYFHLRFLGENTWVKEYLPNIKLPQTKIKAPEEKSFLGRIVGFFWSLLDKVLWRLQLYYMKDKRTRETVERDRILFHPVDLSRKVLAACKVKLYSVKHRGSVEEEDEKDKT